MKSEINNRQVKLETLILRNFKGIRHIELNLNSSLTLIVGKNGVGKSAILEAIKIAYVGLFKRVGTPQFDFPNYLANVHAPLTTSHKFKGQDDCFVRGIFRLPIAQKEDEFDLLYPRTEHICASFSVPDDTSFCRGKDAGRLSSNVEDPDQALKEIVVPGPLLIFYDQKRTFERTNFSGLLTAHSVFTSSGNASSGSVGELNFWYDLKDKEEARQVRDSRQIKELLSNLVYGVSSSGFLIGLGLFDAIFKFDVCDDLLKVCKSSQFSPSSLSTLGQLKHHIEHSIPV